MKKILFSFLKKLIHITPIKNINSLKKIRGVTFQPRKSVIINNIFSIEIPAEWINKSFVIKNNDDTPTYFFSDDKPEFTPSIAIQIENDDGSKFETIINSFKTKIFGKNLNLTKEQISLYDHIDKEASKKYILYGPSEIAGSSFVCYYYYSDIKKTVIIWINLVYVKLFSNTEWRHIVSNILEIIKSGHLINNYKKMNNIELHTYISS